MDDAALTGELKAEALRLGFCLAGVAPAVSPAGFDHLTTWLDQGMAGEMAYMERRRAAYEHPSHVLDGVRSVMMLAANYRTGENPRPDAASDSSPASASLDPEMSANVARYAWNGADYHDLLRARARPLADLLHARRPGCRTRVVVDTAPLLERDFARLAGLGWFGKNTLLIHRRQGSWLLLAALLTDVALTPDAPHDTAHCGTCTRCLEACPTDAFPEPYVLDARRCISYLTIELRDRSIPTDLRKGVGDWLFGCDICQDVCPWNRKSPRTNDPAFAPSDVARGVDPVEILGLSDESFHARFAGTPLARTGRAALARNAAIVLGNRVRAADTADNERANLALCAALRDPEPLVRGAAAWALGEIGGDRTLTALTSRLSDELDPDVRAELRVSIDRQRS